MTGRRSMTTGASAAPEIEKPNCCTCERSRPANGVRPVTRFVSRSQSSKPQPRAFRNDALLASMCSNSTASANAALRPLHERMPVVLEETDWPLWLGEEGDDPGRLLQPSAAAFRAWRISTAVNNVRHDAASLLDPV